MFSSTVGLRENLKLLKDQQFFFFFFSFSFFSFFSFFWGRGLPAVIPDIMHRKGWRIKEQEMRIKEQEIRRLIYLHK